MEGRKEEGKSKGKLFPVWNLYPAQLSLTKGRLQVTHGTCAQYLGAGGRRGQKVKVFIV